MKETKFKSWVLILQRTKGSNSSQSYVDNCKSHHQQVYLFGMCLLWTRGWTTATNHFISISKPIVVFNPLWAQDEWNYLSDQKKKKISSMTTLKLSWILYCISHLTNEKGLPWDTLYPLFSRPAKTQHSIVVLFTCSDP